MIDEAWQQNMPKTTSNAMGCMDDRDYASAFARYVSEVTKDLTLHLEENKIQVDQSFHSLVESIPAKLKLVMLDFTNASYGLPVLTRSPLALLPGHFGRIPQVLMEVSTFDHLVKLQILE